MSVYFKKNLIYIVKNLAIVTTSVWNCLFVALSMVSLKMDHF